MGSSLTRLNFTFEDIERSLDQLKFLLIQTFFFFGLMNGALHIVILFLIFKPHFNYLYDSL